MSDAASVSSGFTTSEAPPEAAPEITVMASPSDCVQPLTVGFGPMYWMSTASLNSAVTASGPALNSEGATLTSTSLRVVLRNPSWRATKAGAWVTFGKKPTRTVETVAAPALPLGSAAPPPELPQAASPIAATASRAVTAAVRRRPMKRVLMSCSSLSVRARTIPTKSVGNIRNTTP